MRMLLITVLLVFVVGACNLVLDSQTSSTEHPPDAETTDHPQHDGGSGGSGDGGCSELPPDAGIYGDAGWYPDAGWDPGDGGVAPDAGLWPDGGP